MADFVSSQILHNGDRFIVAKFTNASDGTGEANVQKIDATSTGPFGVKKAGSIVYPGIHISLVSLWYSVSGMVLRIQWQATANVDLVNLVQSDSWTFLDERGGFGGLTPPVGPAGITGSIAFTTAGTIPATGAGYTVIMKLAKNV